MPRVDDAQLPKSILKRPATYYLAAIVVVVAGLAAGWTTRYREIGCLESTCVFENRWTGTWLLYDLRRLSRVTVAPQEANAFQLELTRWQRQVSCVSTQLATKNPELRDAIYEDCGVLSLRDRFSMDNMYALHRHIGPVEAAKRRLLGPDSLAGISTLPATR